MTIYGLRRPISVFRESCSLVCCSLLYCRVGRGGFRILQQLYRPVLIVLGAVSLAVVVVVVVVVIIVVAFVGTVVVVLIFVDNLALEVFVVFVVVGDGGAVVDAKKNGFLLCSAATGFADCLILVWYSSRRGTRGASSGCVEQKITSA
jgi:hypothetical protein